MGKHDIFKGENLYKFLHVFILTDGMKKRIANFYKGKSIKTEIAKTRSEHIYI